MFKYFYITIIFVIFSTILHAQGKVGSPYSRYSIGEVNYAPLIRNNAMGGLGYTLISNNTVNFVNPAGIANIDTLTFIFDFGLNGGVRQYSTAKSSILKNDYQISYVNFGFAATKWWKIALGYAPYSNIGYNVTVNDTVFDIPLKYNYNGSGGVTRVYWTNAFKPIKKIDLKVGITSSFLFGEIIRTNSLRFNSTYTVDNFMDYYSQNTYRISALNFEAGVQYDIMLKNRNKLFFGVVTNFNNQLRAFKSGFDYNKGPSLGIIDTLTKSENYTKEQKSKISIPQNIGIGIGYLIKDKLYVGIDYKYQDWSKVTFFDKKDSLKNAMYVSAGLEYFPAGYHGNVYKYWQFMKYRFGGYFNQSYCNLTGKEYPINDFGITFGLGFPIKRSKTSFDISFKFGERGTKQNNLIRERYFIAGLAFNLSDIWFIKSKFD